MQKLKSNKTDSSKYCRHFFGKSDAENAEIYFNKTRFERAVLFSGKYHFNSFEIHSVSLLEYLGQTIALRVFYCHAWPM